MTENATRSSCAYCGVGCGVLATPDDGGFRIAGDPAHPANFGRLCSKGSALGETLVPQERLLHPRIGGRDASWDEALGLVASRFAQAIRNYGPDSVAFYVSGQLLTEDYYVANKLMKGFLGSANIDTNSRLCMSSAVVAQQRAFGEDLVPGCYEDLELADLLVLVGSNTAWCHPVLFRRIEEARRERPSMRIVVVDPRRTPTCELADLHLPLASGSDVLLFDGLLAWLSREGHMDTAFVAEHTAGAKETIAAAELAAPDLDSVARGCGLPAALVEEFFRLFAATPRTVTAFSQGVNQSSSGTDKATSIFNVHLLTGRIGKPGACPLSLTGQPNAMGGREVGGLATTLAAHLSLDNKSHRRIAKDFWRARNVAAKPGLKAVELFEAVHEGRIKALWIMATNPAVSLPNADKVRDAIDSCDFVVVSDCIATTETARLAEVLLPAAAWGERSGTTTNSERRLTRQRAFLAPPGDAKPDWWIVSRVAERMGFGGAFSYSSPHEIFDEHARLSAIGNHGSRVFDIGGLAGLSEAEYETLEPLQWPLPWRGHEGTARLFADGRFAHPDGRARLVPTPPCAPLQTTSPDFPFVLNTGRIRDQWHTMTRSGFSPRLAEHLAEPFLDMHPEDAAAAGLAEGDFVRVTTRWGSATLRSRTSGECSRGTLFAPIHWSDANSSSGRVGALVHPGVDPFSGEPEFKHTPAAIERWQPDWRGLLLLRSMPSAPATSWWTRVQGEGFLRFELAGAREEIEWIARDRLSLGLDLGGAGLSEYVDAAASIYRAAVLKDGRLDACLFLAAGPALPSRSWLASLFAKGKLDDDDRLALLAGEPFDGCADASPLVCSCFGVRRAAIESAIAREDLTTTAAIGACLKAGSNCGSCLPELRSLLATATTPRQAA